MKRKHILAVVLIVCIVYIPFVIQVLQLLVIGLNPSTYIIQYATITEVKMSYGKGHIISIEYQWNEKMFTEQELYDMGDYVGEKIPIAIRKDNGTVYRNELVLDYRDISMFVVGICLLLLENYGYTNKRRRYQQRKMKELSQQESRERNMS